MNFPSTRSLDLPSRIRREARVTYGLVWRDLSASLIPGMLMTVAALWSTRSSGSSPLFVLLESFVYFSLYIYTFCLCNQIVGYQEDCINKPDRVLPSGLLSMRGAIRRFVIGLVAFPLAGLAIGGLSVMGWAIAWEAVFLSYNFMGLHRHWFSKNVLFITLGTLVLLAPAWQIAAPLTAQSWQWILVVSISFGATLHLQDLRDVKGDRATGRVTLPLAFGDGAARWMIALAIGVLPVLIHWTLFAEAGSPRLVELVLAGLNLVVAVRTVRRRSAHADHKTYMLHTYWFCMVIAAAAFVL